MVLLLLLFLAGCADPWSACDPAEVSYFKVELVAEDGGDLSGATVSYQLDGGSPVACDVYGSVWTCAYEQPGVFTVLVEADGYEAIALDIPVATDDCRASTEQFVLTMASEGCTQEVVPSVLVSVLGSTGEALTGVAVTWSRTNAEAAPQDCPNYVDDVWICGEEVAGELEIDAVADGHVGQTQVVTVGADRCHVHTEGVSFFLEWAPD
jgi:hypothetical protein